MGSVGKSSFFALLPCLSAGRGFGWCFVASSDGMVSLWFLLQVENPLRMLLCGMGFGLVFR